MPRKIRAYSNEFLRRFILILLLIGFFFLLGLKGQEKNSNNFRFAVTGHVYSNPNDFEYILRDLDGKNIENLFIGGDIENDILYKLDEFEKEHNVKIIPAPGNHEIQDSTSEEDYYKRFGNFKTVEISGVNFIILNTLFEAEPPYSHGGSSIKGNQLEFLKQELERLRKKPIAIIMHHALWSSGLSQEEKLEIAQNSNLNPEYELENIQLPSNDANSVGPDNWMQEIHPMLMDHGNVSVFSGDASLSTVFKKDGVEYYTTGLRHREKGEWVKDDLQSFVVCSFEKRISCQIEYFSSDDNLSSQENIYEKFISTLSELIQKKSYLEISPLINGEDRLSKKLKNIKYLSVEKDDSCSFPEASIVVQGGGLYELSKNFERGIEIDKNTRFYFIDNQERRDSFIDKIYFYRFDNPADECKSFKVSFFDHDFKKDLKIYKKNLPEFNIEIDEKNYQRMQSAIPTEKERYTSDFRFKYVNGILKTGEEEAYKIKIKNRGGTATHWLKEKKSYTVKLKDRYQKMKKVLFYVPEKRAYVGEFLINKLSEIIGLQALNSDFKNLTLNGENHGTYYVSEDFEVSFLAKRNLPEANIYNTDPYKNPSTFDVESIEKDVFLSTVNEYKKDYDRDIDFFLSVIKKDNKALEKNWQRYFNPDNLARILAIYSMTGTAHYDLHNIVFYINPSDGRIYFFPWDLMNHTHAGNLNRESLKSTNNDFLNLNQIFSRLLEVPEIRDRRNQVIFEYSNELVNYLDNFYTNENVRLFSNFLTDPTVEFYVGEGNRPALISLIEIPMIIKNNVIFLKEKISKDDLESQFFKEKKDNRIKIGIKNNGFSSEIIKSVLLEDQTGEFKSISINGKKLDKHFFKIENFGSSIKIIFKKNIALNPKLEYKKEYAAPVIIVPGLKLIELSFSESTGRSKMSVELENGSTKKSTKIESRQRRQDFEQYFAEEKESEDIFQSQFLKKTEKDNVFKFASHEIKIDQDLILPSKTKLIIEPGTRVDFGENVSLVSFGEIDAQGTAEKPIVFTSSGEKGWGSLALVHEKSKGSFKYCIFEKGNDGRLEEIYFSGMLSGYFSNIEIDNCTFRLANQNGGDDAVNLKNGNFKIENSSFVENKFDAVDYDYANFESCIKNNLFQSNGNDGIDISGSQVEISKNIIEKAGDKCISIGENSDVLMKNNFLRGCNFGLAVKDSSRATFINNELYENEIGVAAYNKKEYFGGAEIRVYNSLFKDNGQDFGIEVISADDFRSKNRWYDSECKVYNSSYKFSRKRKREIIKFPKEKKSLSKKQILKAYLFEDFNKIGYEHALLENNAEEVEMNSGSSCENCEIGIIEANNTNPLIQ